MGVLNQLFGNFMPGEIDGLPDGGWGGNGSHGNMPTMPAPQQIPAEGTYASRAAKLKRMRAMADKLREDAAAAPADKFMPGWTSALTGARMSDRLVAGGNDVGTNILRGLGSIGAAYKSRDLDQQDAELDRQARDEAMKALQGLPSMTGTRTVEQTVPGEEVPVEQAPPTNVPTSPYGTTEASTVMPGTMLPQARAQLTRTPDTIKQVQEQYNLTPEEYSAKLNQFGAGLDPTNPYTSDIRGAVLKQALTMPEKIIETREKAAELGRIAREKYETQLQIANQQHEARMATLHSQEERDRETRQFRKDMADLNASFKQQQLDIQKQGLDLRQRETDAKLTEKQVKADEKAKEIQQAREGVDRQLENVQKTAEKLIDVKTGNPKYGLYAGTGVYNSMLPNALVGTKSNEARKDLKTLQNQMTMISLADAKKAAGQSFGSMQVQEWEKFQNQVTNLDIDNPTVEKDIAEIYAYVTKIREGLKAAGEAPPAVPPAVPPGGGTPPAVPPAKKPSGGTVNFGDLPS